MVENRRALNPDTYDIGSVRVYNGYVCVSMHVCVLCMVTRPIHRKSSAQPLSGPPTEAVIDNFRE